MADSLFDFKSNSSNSGNKVSDGSFYLDSLFNAEKPKIMGLPPSFLTDSDYDQENYKTILSPVPVVTIYPCVPVLKAFKDTDVELGKKAMEAWTSDDPSSEKLYTDLIKSMHDNIENAIELDARAMVLQYAAEEYYNSLNTILARIAAGFGINTFKFNRTSDVTNKYGGINYYTTANTSVTESGGHSYDKSIFEQLMNSASNTAQAFSSIMRGFGFSEASEADIGEMQQNTASGLLSGKKFIGTQSKIARILKGDKTIMPRMWQDSNFGRSYNLEFQFQSVYGDRLSIFQEVLLPLASLMAMFLPRQTGLSTYNGPFLVRVDCKGLFTIDTGCITSFTIEKSKEDMTAYGMFKKVTVSITVEDLYPTLISSPNSDLLSCNFGLSQFIDNMSLLSYDQSYNNMSVNGRIRQAFFRSISQIGSTIDSKWAKMNIFFNENNPFNVNVWKRIFG